MDNCPQRTAVCSDQNSLARLQLGNNDGVPVLKGPQVRHLARLREVPRGQCSPLSLVEVQRGSALIGLELHSVATSAFLCHKEPVYCTQSPQLGVFCLLLPGSLWHKIGGVSTSSEQSSALRWTTLPGVQSPVFLHRELRLTTLLQYQVQGHLGVIIGGN